MKRFFKKKIIKYYLQLILSQEISNGLVILYEGNILIKVELKNLISNFLDQNIRRMICKLIF
jgi:hypothetical protein